MAEEPKKKGSWLKGILGTIAGLASGAVAMYVSPLVNTVVKPPKPLANFAVETDGLNATFHNRFAGEGWWDFGDASPLEPATPQQASVNHTYSKPGTYTAKLSVRNFLGEEHERTVPVSVTAESSSSQASGVVPAIATLEAAPVSASRVAPATFRLTAATANAERCVWNLGGDRPLEVAASSDGKYEHLVTLATPGPHTLEFIALSGSQAVKKTVSVQVDPPPPGTFFVRLHVTDRGLRADKRQTTEMVPLNLPRQARTGHMVDRRLDARAGFTITEAKLGQVDPALQSLKLTVAAGGKSVHLAGKIMPTSAMMEAPNPPMVPVILTQERQTKMAAPPAEITAAITFPGSVVVPLPALPADCAAPQRSMLIELRGASGPIWQQPLPASSVMDFQGKRYTIRATPAGNEVRVEIVPGAVGLTARER